MLSVTKSFSFGVWLEDQQIGLSFRSDRLSTWSFWKECDLQAQKQNKCI